MRVFLASVLVTMTTAALTVATAPAATPGKLRAVLTVAGPGPVTVTGMRFLPRERVTVLLSVTGQDRLSRSVVASRTGRIVVRFTGQTAPDCGGYVMSARAIGARGSTAAVRRLEIPPPCGIAPQP